VVVTCVVHFDAGGLAVFEDLSHGGLKWRPFLVYVLLFIASGEILFFLASVVEMCPFEEIDPALWQTDVNVLGRITVTGLLLRGVLRSVVPIGNRVLVHLSEVTGGRTLALTAEVRVVRLVGGHVIHLNALANLNLGPVNFLFVSGAFPSEFRIGFVGGKVTGLGYSIGVGRMPNVDRGFGTMRGGVVGRAGVVAIGLLRHGLEQGL